MVDISGCSGPYKISMYYAGGGIVPIDTIGYPEGVETPIPRRGRIALSNFFGAIYNPIGFTNGNFENTNFVTETTTRVDIPGWVIYKQNIRLNGASILEDFPTPNTVATLTPAVPAPMISPGDNIAFDLSIVNNPLFEYALIDTSLPANTGLASPGGTGNFILRLRNKAVFAGPVAVNNPNNYGILRGPYMVSKNTLDVNFGDRFYFEWRAEKDLVGGDNYAVFIYALNIQNGLTITLLDTIGASSGGWQTVSRPVLRNEEIGYYKFIIVHGSYDGTGGSQVGSYLWLDNIRVDKSGTFPAETTTTTTYGGGGTTTTTTSTTSTTTSTTTQAGGNWSIIPAIDNIRVGGISFVFNWTAPLNTVGSTRSWFIVYPNTQTSYGGLGFNATDLGQSGNLPINASSGTVTIPTNTVVANQSFQIIITDGSLTSSILARSITCRILVA